MWRRIGTARAARARAPSGPSRGRRRDGRAPRRGPRASRAEPGRERIRQALDSLPLKARTIIMLSDIEGLSYREIAQVLNCPIGTVMSRLHNARRKLRVLLGPMLVALLVLGHLLAAGPAWAQPVIR